MLFALLILLPLVLGQSWQPYLDSLVQALNARNLTALASASATLGASDGQCVVDAIARGNWTLFAPTNAALKCVAANHPLSAGDVRSLLSYHIVAGNYTALTPPYPNITLGRTLLNASSLVQLQGNQSQAVAWSKEGNGLFVLNNGTIIPVVNTVKWNNIQINEINSVLLPPPNMTWIFGNSTYNCTSVGKAFASVTIPGNNSTTFLDAVTNARGITLFAPDDNAFNTAKSKLASLSSNTSAIISLFGNHIINGQTVYSPGFRRPKAVFISGSGEPFAFTLNSSGTYVSSGGSNVARIVRSDALTSNGVVHVIDNILWDTNVNAAAATSAFRSATSAAAASMTTETSPIEARAFAQAEHSS